VQPRRLRQFCMRPLQVGFKGLPMQTTPEYDAFTAFLDKLVKVPAETVKVRVEEHRAQAKRNPRRPGPKPKVKPSASDPCGQPNRD
jgi:hypothetical protein